MRKAEPRRPNFVVTKYRGKTEIKRGLSKRTLDRNENINGGLQVPTIRANDLSTRMKPASRLLVPTDKTLTVKGKHIVWLQKSKLLLVRNIPDRNGHP